jgi:hypothetical protein
MPAALLMTLEAQRNQHHWSPPTWENILGTALGTLNRLSMYTDAVADMSLADTAVWKDALRAAKIATREFQTKPPHPATKENVQVAITRQLEKGRKDIAAQIAIAWLTAARVGDVLQLKQENISLGSGPTAKLDVQFRRGKTVRMKTAYTVQTTCPGEWIALVKECLDRAQPGHFLWPAASLTARKQMGKDVTQALRLSNPELEQRSLRRGALQTMADAGVPEEVLLMFSQHTSMSMLRRYLDWGRKGSHKASTSRNAANFLSGGSI